MNVTTDHPVRINRTIIAAAWSRRAPGTRIVVPDAECGGLALVVNSKSMTWRYDYRPRGIDPITGRRWPCRSSYLANADAGGSHDSNEAAERWPAPRRTATPAIADADAARRWAQSQKGTVADGRDPAVERRQKLRQAVRERSNTLGRLFDEYAALLPTRPKLRGAGAPSPGHVAVELRALRMAIAEMDAADQPAAGLAPARIKGMLAAQGVHPGAARARFGALSRFYDWLLDDERIPVNPCQLLGRASRPKAPAARGHYLRPDQLATLWRAAEALDPVRRDFCRLLIAIPCRRGEATSLDWQHLELATGTWSQPAKLTKNGEPHRLHLHPLALGVLRARHEAAGGPDVGLVFPAPRSHGQMSTWRNVKNELVAASGIPGWRLHDMRRSFASALGEAGVPEPVVDAILNHRQSATRSGVLGVYQRAERWPEQMAAMQRWGELLAAAIDGRTPGATVTPIRAGRRRAA